MADKPESLLPADLALAALIVAALRALERKGQPILKEVEEELDVIFRNVREWPGTRASDIALLKNLSDLIRCR